MFNDSMRLFPELIPSVDARRGVSRRFRDFRDRLLAVDQTAYLESLLVRQDKMSMSESVEARVPFVHLPLLKQVNQAFHAIRGCPVGSPNRFSNGWRTNTCHTIWFIVAK